MPFLYDKLEPMEFMLFVGQLYGMERAELVRASDELFDVFGLDEIRRRRSKTCPMARGNGWSLPPRCCISPR